MTTTVRMQLGDLLDKRRHAIVKRWRAAVVDTYPEDARRFLRREKDRFANPVGQSIHRAIEGLFDLLVQGAPPEQIRACLDPVIRIRAVQDFTPSVAVGFILELKGILRQSLSGQVSPLDPEMHALEDRIDQLALLAFDMYAECRARLQEIRVNEMARHYGRLLARAGVAAEALDETESERDGRPMTRE